MADGFACKSTSPREVPWPESIILTAHSFIRVCLFIPNPRAGWLRQLKHAWNKFHGFLRRRSRAGASKTAIETRIGQGAKTYVSLMVYG